MTYLVVKWLTRGCSNTRWPSDRLAPHSYLILQNTPITDISRIKTAIPVFIRHYIIVHESIISKWPNIQTTVSWLCHLRHSFCSLTYFKDYEHVQRLPINTKYFSPIRFEFIEQLLLAKHAVPHVRLRKLPSYIVTFHPNKCFHSPHGDTWRHFNTETGDEITLYKPERQLDFMGNPRASLDTYLTVMQRFFSLFHETH